MSNHHSEIAAFIASCTDTLLQDMLSASEVNEEAEKDLLALQYARLAQMFVTMGLYMHFKFENIHKSTAAPEAARAANKKLHTYLENKFNEIEDQEEKSQNQKVLGSQPLN